ncbi:MAG: STAS/SEC14 domain-containing protein [Labilibaculum antarcticum]
MKNSYYMYVKEHKLLVECFCGEIEFKDVVELKKEIEDNLKEEVKINILVDIQEDISTLSIEKLDNFTQFYQNSGFISRIGRMAVVTSTPTQVVKTMLLIDALKENNTSIKVFSSIKSALDWLNTGIDLNRVKSILKNFKTPVC